MILKIILIAIALYFILFLYSEFGKRQVLKAACKKIEAEFGVMPDFEYIVNVQNLMKGIHPLAWSCMTISELSEYVMKLVMLYPVHEIIKYERLYYNQQEEEGE